MIPIKFKCDLQLTNNQTKNNYNRYLVKEKEKERKKKGKQKRK